MKKISSEDIKRASKIAQRNMKDTIREMSGWELRGWIGLWNATLFTPNRGKK